MSVRKFVLGIIAVLVAPCISLADEGPRYTYVEAGYVDFDPDAGVSDDGAYAEGSLRIFRNFHLLAEYNDVGDFTFWSAGGGWHGLLGEKADLFAEILWDDVDVDSTTADVSDDGYEVSGGIRWNLLKWLELKGQINRVDLDKAGDDTLAEVEAMVSILKGRLGLGANYEFGDNDTLKVFGRFSFGK